MKLTSAHKLLLATNLALVFGFGWYYLQSANYEFVAYAGTILLVSIVLTVTQKFSRFPSYIWLGITLWAVMHMLGGSVQTVDGVLYAYRIVPFFDGGGEFYILKYDQVVHAFLYGVVGLMFYHLLRVVVGVRSHRVFIAATAIFAAAGFSIINEIIEFLAAVNLPETGVGGYHNTVLDMIFNLGGATIAVLLYLIRERHHVRD